MDQVSIAKKKMKYTAPVGYWQRYVVFLKYGTLKKHFNFLLSLINWKLGKSHLKTMPSFLKVEITRECNVGCKLCLVEKPSWHYSLNNYRQLVDKLKNHIYLVSLYDIGEPLENKEVIAFIQYAKQNKLGSIISTSLSIKKSDEFWEAFVLSGLDKLIVAIDGITAEVYNTYRTNGDLSLIMENLKKILYYKEMHHIQMYIEWQMIDFKWNLHEQKSAREMAYQMGCSNFRLIREAVKPRLRYKKENIIRRRNCMLPYIIFIVTADNKVRPCYKVYNEPVEIGDLSKNSFEEIWNGDEVFRIRDKNRICDRTGCKTCQE